MSISFIVRIIQSLFPIIQWVNQHTQIGDYVLGEILNFLNKVFDLTCDVYFSANDVALIVEPSISCPLVVT